MQYKEIVSVTGLGGLFHLLATKSDGAIVRSLADNTTKFIPSRLHNVTPLESIEIYTTGSNVRLHEVLQKMQESDSARPNVKAGPDEIRGYFKGVYPEMDEDRVYSSDMKKMLRWYEILQGAGLLDFSAINAAAEESAAVSDEIPAEGKSQEVEQEKQEDSAALTEEGEEKPAKKAKAKKAATAEDGEEKPAKKAAAKKAADTGVEGAEAPKKAAKPKKKDAE